ncbi:Hsp33 family molecular chaperone [Stappia taiwanensis]|uniref:Hsp33 family molecular chaperone n=1 Tax=Stappia taiwanensis TaxID=992267 RepID=A0A838XUJ8_9HYPH|nr:Hsp33 family molecular chaperone [Stappia taiwanensis]MBA4612186.1 Hsp33 family molecular chaperone [Stappia taiwanensis]GGE92930.1 33 kDa chaperonin [Stappia taiwanensis]
MTVQDELQRLGVSPAGRDAVLPFAVEPLDVRGRAVFLGPMLDAILDRHQYPVSVSRLVAEAAALVCLLGTSLKFDGRFTLQTTSDGPVSMLVVDFDTPDGLRACAEFDAEAVAAAEARGEADAVALLGRGHLAMTVDQGANMNRYQGIVALDGHSLEEVAHQYFAQSEQIPTIVRLAVGEMLDRREGDSPRHSWLAGGILAQFLPEAPERMRQPDLHPGDAPEGVKPHEVDEDEAWREARALVGTVRDDELGDPEMTAERLLFRLFHERGVRIFTPQPLTDRCRCSDARIRKMLAGFSADDLDHMTVDGRIEVTCRFCNARYDYDAGEIVPGGSGTD